jgi:hypothetical protein
MAPNPPPAPVIGKKRAAPDDFRAYGNLPAQAFTADGEDIENKTPLMQVFGEKLVRMPMRKMTMDGGGHGEGGSEKEAAVAKGKGLVEGLVMKTNGKMEVEALRSCRVLTRNS